MIHPSAGGKKHWLLIVDEAIDYTHTFFLKKKSDLVETMIIWIKNLFMKYISESRKSDWTTVEKTECSKQKQINKIWENI